ncbi:hypothetical protein AB0K16_19840 [Nonomuraea jabiensis]|uniref:hypothetical protein n=1 Tax=Nonomuraea jabiensis TaxID=882448 RepID=UPI0034143B63
MRPVEHFAGYCRQRDGHGSLQGQRIEPRGERAALGFALGGLLYGVLLGTVFGLIGYLTTRGGHGIVSRQAVVADRYDIVADIAVADDARNLLAGTTGAISAG